MRLPVAPISRLIQSVFKKEGRDGLVFQRLFWGAVVGCVAAVFLGESPFLESLELSMLKWRYKTSSRLSQISAEPAPVGRHQAPHISRDIVLVAFDDYSQFDLGIARFNDVRSQDILARVLDVIESGDPVLIGVDLDLRGATSEKLVTVFQRWGNIVISLFGSLEGSTDLPSADFMTYAAAYGYGQLFKESNGIVYRLPISYPVDSSDKESGIEPIPSFTEAIIQAYRLIREVGPFLDYVALSPDQPVYIDFRDREYPRVSFQEILSPSFDTSVFSGKVVLIGSTLTARKDDPLKVDTPLADSVSSVVVQADAVSTLLDRDVIFSFPRHIARHLLIVFGAVFGSLASLMTMGPRTAVVMSAAAVLLLIAQIAFQVFHVAVPVVPPLAVLFSCFVLGTVIFLDTDLRQRNKELAQARESMQVRAEQERQRIAEDLHDETLPALSSVARMADTLTEEMSESPTPREMRAKLDFAVTEMRRVINDLHPSVLETMGFVPALENLLTILSRETSIEADFTDRTDGRDYELPMFIQLQLYRIVQEALNNVQKHSQADRVELQIGSENGRLMLSVADNGRGIDLRSVKKDSHGLLNIRQRAQLIGAQVEWSRPQEFQSGTEVRVKINLSGDRITGRRV